MSKANNRVLDPLTKPKPLRQAERNLAHIQFMKIVKKQMQQLLKGVSK